jgi:glycosyltransferase involved in cell wall biosynthesis
MSRPPIKIAHVLTSIRDGGLERVVLELCRGLPSDRFESEVCALLEDNPWSDIFLAEGIPVRSFSARNRGGWRSIGFNAMTTLRLAAHLRRTKADIVVVHDFFPGVLGRVASILSGTPKRIATLHATYDWLGPTAGFVNRLLGRGTHALVCVSNAAKAASIQRDRLPLDLYRVVPNGIDVRKFHPDPESGRALRASVGWAESDFIVGCVGVLRESKRQIDLVKAVAKLMPDHPNLRLVLVGSARLHEAASSNRLMESLRGLPPGRWNLVQDQREIASYYNSFDMVSLPSESEGFGLVLAEALASGCSCLVADIPAHREVASDAALYHVPRDPDSIATGIVKFQTDADLRNKLGSLAPSIIESKFSLNQMIEGWASALEEVHRGDRPSPLQDPVDDERSPGVR